jgi:hypothetical protein
MSLHRFHFCFLFLIYLLSAGYATAQDLNITQLPVQLIIPPKACINLATSESDTLNLKKTEQVLSPNSNNKAWINYSSVVDKNTTNSICASLSSNNLPPEIIVVLHISENYGEGTGKLGKSAGPINLSDFPQEIITDIGTCFTGEGWGNGHLLTYTWELAPGASAKDIDIDDINLEIRVIFTIVNNE